MLDFQLEINQNRCKDQRLSVSLSFFFSRPPPEWKHPRSGGEHRHDPTGGDVGLADAALLARGVPGICVSWALYKTRPIFWRFSSETRNIHMYSQAILVSRINKGAACIAQCTLLNPPSRFIFWQRFWARPFFHQLQQNAVSNFRKQPDRRVKPPPKSACIQKSN